MNIIRIMLTSKRFGLSIAVAGNKQLKEVEMEETPEAQKEVENIHNEQDDCLTSGFGNHSDKDKIMVTLAARGPCLGTCDNNDATGNRTIVLMQSPRYKGKMSRMPNRMRRRRYPKSRSMASPQSLFVFGLVLVVVSTIAHSAHDRSPAAAIASHSRGFQILHSTMANQFATHSSSYSRSLQTTTGSTTDTASALMQMTLRFSIWIPEFTDEDYKIDSLSTNETDLIRRAVLLSTLDELCSEGSLRVMEYTVVFDPLLGQDLCPSLSLNATAVKNGGDSRLRWLQSSRRRALLQGTNQSSIGYPAIIDKDPLVTVRRRARGSLTWSIWTLRYTVLQIGDIYIEEALQNQPELALSDLAESSVIAMQHVMQLGLDVAIMEGAFDESLAATFAQFSIVQERQPPDGLVRLPLQVHSSPIRLEVETFTALNTELYTGDFYNVPKFSLMRLAGLALFFGTVVCLLFLQLLARRRRRAMTHASRVTPAGRSRDGETEDTVVLGSRQGVEEMLQNSATPLQLGVAMTLAPSARAQMETKRAAFEKRPARNVPNQLETPTTGALVYRDQPTTGTSARASVKNKSTAALSSRRGRRREKSSTKAKSGVASTSNSTLNAVSVAINEDGSIESFVRPNMSPPVVPSLSGLQSTGRSVDEDHFAQSLCVDDTDDDDNQGLMQLPQNLQLSPVPRKGPRN
jgi:hypothetical protein